MKSQSVDAFEIYNLCNKETQKTYKIDLITRVIWENFGNYQTL